MTERFDFGATAKAAYQACLALPKYMKSSSLDWGLQELIKIRASMVNGCATCLDGHTADAAQHGESLRRIASLATWKEAACYSDRERAALAFTDEMTLISQGGVSDAVWEQMAQHFSDEEIAEVMTAIIAINVFNRITITTHKIPEDLKAARLLTAHQ